MTIFAKIIAREIPADIVYETETVGVSRRQPQAPVRARDPRSPWCHSTMPSPKMPDCWET